MKLFAVCALALALAGTASGATHKPPKIKVGTFKGDATLTIPYRQDLSYGRNEGSVRGVVILSGKVVLKIKLTKLKDSTGLPIYRGDMKITLGGGIGKLQVLSDAGASCSLDIPSNGINEHGTLSGFSLFNPTNGFTYAQVSGVIENEFGVTCSLLYEDGTVAETNSFQLCYGFGFVGGVGSPVLPDPCGLAGVGYGHVYYKPAHLTARTWVTTYDAAKLRLSFSK